MSTLKQFKRRALARPEVKAAYDASADKFAFLDEVLRARAEAGLTQAEVAARIGTTQSAIARLESAEPKHSPSIATQSKNDVQQRVRADAVPAVLRVRAAAQLSR
jgi:DNA-binding XRE family transcriptional regulator